MNKKISACLLAALVLCLACAAALASTANATIVAPNTEKIIAPMNGTLLPFDLSYGDAVSAGDVLFGYDTTPVYAPVSGKVAAVFAAEGDDAAGTAGHYGSLAVIEPEHPLYVDASTQEAYDNDDNRYVHAGETVYLKCGDDKGTGIVTSVFGKNYTVEILTGKYDVGDTIRCFRESGMPNDSEIGRGKATRYNDTAIKASGRIAKVCVAPGQSVKVGDVLFEVIDSQSAPNAELTISAKADGAVTAMNTVSGAQVYRGQLLCEIANLSKLELSAEIDEIDLQNVSVGSVLAYTLDAYPNEKFYGTVTEIRPMGLVKQNATYFDVRMTLSGSKLMLPGMNATVYVGE